MTDVWLVCYYNCPSWVTTAVVSSEEQAKELTEGNDNLSYWKYVVDDPEDMDVSHL